MRVVVTGATGNVGTSVLEQLAKRPEVDQIIGVARRAPGREFAKTTFVQLDIGHEDLEPTLRGADALIHLAWLIQPSRNERITHAVNVGGSHRVFTAAARAKVPRLIYASSVGAYSPGSKDTRADESWPTEGISSSFYSRHKVAVERMLTYFESAHPEMRVVRLRPGLIFKPEAATEIRRLFLGPFIPNALLSRRLIPVVPDVERLVFQAVHSSDIGAAYALATINDDARGAFNIAADPVIGPRELARVMSAKPVSLSPRVLRTAMSAAYRLRLIPPEPGWLDLALGVPLMNSSRASRELGWQPQFDALTTLKDLFDGMARAEDLDTAPLARETSGPARSNELKTGVGARP